jgi:hypothetical protein
MILILSALVGGGVGIALGLVLMNATRTHDNPGIPPGGTHPVDPDREEKIRQFAKRYGHGPGPLTRRGVTGTRWE